MLEQSYAFKSEGSIYLNLEDDYPSSSDELELYSITGVLVFLLDLFDSLEFDLCLSLDELLGGIILV